MKERINSFIIKSIEATNFKVLVDDKLEFDKDYNYIVRANETGKSTLILLIKVLFYYLGGKLVEKNFEGNYKGYEERFYKNQYILELYLPLLKHKDSLYEPSVFYDYSINDNDFRLEFLFSSDRIDKNLYAKIGDKLQKISLDYIKENYDLSYFSEIDFSKFFIIDERESKSFNTIVLDNIINILFNFEKINTLNKVFKSTFIKSNGLSASVFPQDLKVSTIKDNIIELENKLSEYYKDFQRMKYLEEILNKRETESKVYDERINSLKEVLEKIWKVFYILKDERIRNIKVEDEAEIKNQILEYEKLIKKLDEDIQKIDKDYKTEIDIEENYKKEIEQCLNRIINIDEELKNLSILNLYKKLILHSKKFDNIEKEIIQLESEKRRLEKERLQLIEKRAEYKRILDEIKEKRENIRKAYNKVKELIELEFTEEEFYDRHLKNTVYLEKLKKIFSKVFVDTENFQFIIKLNSNKLDKEIKYSYDEIDGTLEVGKKEKIDSNYFRIFVKDKFDIEVFVENKEDVKEDISIEKKREIVNIYKTKENAETYLNIVKEAIKDKDKLIELLKKQPEKYITQIDERLKQIDLEIKKLEEKGYNLRQSASYKDHLFLMIRKLKNFIEIEEINEYLEKDSIGLEENIKDLIQKSEETIERKASLEREKEDLIRKIKELKVNILREKKDKTKDEINKLNQRLIKIQQTKKELDTIKDVYLKEEDREIDINIENLKKELDLSFLEQYKDKELQNIIEEYYSKERELNNLEREKLNNNSEIEKLRLELKNLKEKLEHYSIETLSSELNKLNKYLELHKKLYGLISITSKVLEDYSKNVYTQIFKNPVFVNSLNNYLKKITSGKYKRAILYSYDFMNIKDKKEERKFTDYWKVTGENKIEYYYNELSDGAKDQFALSVLLALLDYLKEEYNFGKVPIVFDEPFAYTDSKRKSNLLKIFKENISNNYQVIIFSCKK